MNNGAASLQNSSPVSFWDEMIEMEKELPLAMQQLLYKKVKKMRALVLANQFDANNYHFQLSEQMLDELLQQIANER
jgi:hypothetical protein